MFPPRITGIAAGPVEDPNPHAVPMAMRSSTEYARKNARLQRIRINAGMPWPAQRGEQSLENTPPRLVRVAWRCAGHAMMFTPPST